MTTVKQYGRRLVVEFTPSLPLANATDIVRAYFDVSFPNTTNTIEQVEADMLVSIEEDVTIQAAGLFVDDDNETIEAAGLLVEEDETIQAAESNPESNIIQSMMMSTGA